MENLSHEHAATCGDEVDCVGMSVQGGLGSMSARSKRPTVCAVYGTPNVDPLASVPLEAPPPGLWSKIEAQLRHEGVIH